MPEPADISLLESTMWLIGIAGSIIFYGRFYVQWIVSEMQKRSVVPVVFWYMSSIGSVLLFIYGVWTGSPMGSLSQTFNLVVYSRNLKYIWQERGVLSERREKAVRTGVIGIVTITLALTALVWYAEYEATRGEPEVHETWLWLAVGLLAQALFAFRFLLQWLATELHRKSVVPVSFWYISLLASGLLAAHFFSRGPEEWLYGIGLVASCLIYIRNIWLIHGQPLPNAQET